MASGELKYDIEDPDERRSFRRAAHADDAWYFISSCREALWALDALLEQRSVHPDELRGKITEILDEIPVVFDEVWF